MSTPSDNGQGQTPEQIEAEIEAKREALAATVDQLSAKLDVKGKAQRKVADVKDRATTDTGSPRPEVIAAAGSLVAMTIALVWWLRHRD